MRYQLRNSRDEVLLRYAFTASMGGAIIFAILISGMTGLTSGGVIAVAFLAVALALGIFQMSRTGRNYVELNDDRLEYVRLGTKYSVPYADITEVCRSNLGVHVRVENLQGPLTWRLRQLIRDEHGGSWLHFRLDDPGGLLSTLGPRVDPSRVDFFERQYPAEPTWRQLWPRVLFVGMSTLLFVAGLMAIVVAVGIADRPPEPSP